MKAASISPRRKNSRINSDNSMGLAKRIIPCLDVDKGRVVKGVKFVGIRDAGNPVEIARRYDEQGADELVFLDITASHEDRDTMVHMVEEVAGQVFIPLTVGGGLRSTADLRRLLIAGGGVGYLNHLVEGVQQGGADAVLAASIFHFGERTVEEAKRHLAAHGVEVRLPKEGGAQ